MRTFCRAVCIIVGVVALQPAARAQDTGAAAAASPEAFARLLQDRYDAGRADYREFLERTIGDSHVSFLEAGDLQRLAKAQVVAALLKYPGGVPPMPRPSGSGRPSTTSRYSVMETRRWCTIGA